jgi:maleylacetoacetate isomerase
MMKLNKLTLYSNAFNSAGERVRIALALKQVEYRYVSIQDIGWEKYAEINPQVLLPTLEVGNDLLVQSPAILEYLEETCPTPSLLPDDPIVRAHARAFAQAITSEMHAIDVLRTRQFLSERLDVPKAGVEQWTDHWFELGMTALEGFLLQRREAYPYCFGENPGWADVFLVPQLRKSVGRYFQDISKYPLVGAVYERCLLHPAFIEAAAEQQPDFAVAYSKITIRGQNDGITAGI